MQLRDYQQLAVNSVYCHLRNKPDTNPCVVIPTGGGKSLVIAKIVTDAAELWNGRCLILAHVKELLEQNAAKIAALCPELRIGVFSAGLNSRDTEEQVIVAGIQSVYNKADELGDFDLIIIDESHLIPPDGDGMYRTFLEAMKDKNPNVRIIGMTATPYRLKGGLICKPENILNEVCYEISVRELIVAGFLSKLKSKNGKNKADLANLHIRGGEFIPEEIAEKMDNERLVHDACSEVARLTKDRKKVLIFASSVEHARHIKKEIEEHSETECGFVVGDTPKEERAEVLARFKGEKIPVDLFGHEASELKYLVNVAVLTTGFDAPAIDCIVLLRPTNSPGLYYQMVGRGFRLSPDTGKTDCLVLDYGQNIMRHGPVDMIRIEERLGRKGQNGPPMRECPVCQAVFMASYTSCPDCGYEFPKSDLKLNHGTHAASDGILSGEDSEIEYDVKETFYATHEKRGADPDAPKTLRVDYLIGFNDFQSQWICPEHTGWARKKFEAWWKERAPEDVPPPDTAREASAMANQGILREPLRIAIRTVAGSKFPEIVKFELKQYSRIDIDDAERSAAGDPDTKEEFPSSVRTYDPIRTEEDALRYADLVGAEYHYQAKQAGFIDIGGLPDDPDEREERLAIMQADVSRKELAQKYPGLVKPAATASVDPHDLTEDDIPF